jgi:V8-like Glu-specific endopeptidase
MRKHIKHAPRDPKQRFPPLRAALTAASAMLAGGCLTSGAATVPQPEATQLGLVSISTFPAGSPPGVVCSGVLLTNNWVLTAGHCLDALTGKVTQVTVPGAPGVFTMDALYKFGVSANDTTGPDIGLIRLSAPVPNGGFTNRFFTRLNRTNPVGKSVTLYGQSTGAYLKTTSTVASAAGRNLKLQANSTGSTTAPGDSGGPTFLAENGQTLLVGLTTTTGGTIAAIHPAVNWLIAATRTFLDQTRPFAATVVMADEIAAQPEGNRFGGTNSQVGRDWPSVQRSVTMMCAKRGFIGGTLVPDTTVANGVLKIACIGRTGGSTMQASQAQIDATQSGFNDLGSVGWAQAGRAAARLCASLPGTIGGFFDGSVSGSVGAQTLGLVCVNRNAGEFVDADSSSLPTLGQADLNTVDWLAARAEVSTFCRGFGFEGGIANGNQIPGKRGVACIGKLSIELGGFGTTPASVLAHPRALYAISIDEPLVAPPGAAIDVGLTFEPCRGLIASTQRCPVVPAFEQWSYSEPTHRLVHVASGRCVNISGARKDSDALIILFPCSGAPNEKWSIITKTPSVQNWRIKSDFSGLCLTAIPGHAAQSKNGTLVLARVGTLAQRPCDGSDSQLFGNVDADFFRREGPR